MNQDMWHPALIADNIRRQLVLRRRWNMFRYLHLLDIIERVRPRKVVSVGCGVALAETLIALQHPEIDFYCSDLARHFRIAAGFNLQNIHFEEKNLFDIEGEYDLVFTIEVLEHILNARDAAKHLMTLVKLGGHLFNIVPFASEEEQANPRLKKRCWEKFEHHVVGYDVETFTGFFEGFNVVSCEGLYWHDRGVPLRAIMTKMPDELIVKIVDELFILAGHDIRSGLPKNAREAGGLKVLAQRPITELESEY